MVFRHVLDQAHASHRMARVRRAALALALLPLAGCGTDRIITGSIVPDAYQDRHPIVLGERPITLSVFAAGPKLERNTRARLVEMGQSYRSEGEGQIEILVPTGGFHDQGVRAAVPAINAALAEGGARGNVSVGSYPVADPQILSPIRVSYRAIRARVTSKCGQWPADLGSASSLEGWENRPYWNLGCASQATLAAQVDDPRDLVEPRATTPSDVEMRTRAIGKVRQGNDPGTTWLVKNSAIGSVGGQ